MVSLSLYGVEGKPRAKGEVVVPRLQDPVVVWWSPRRIYGPCIRNSTRLDFFNADPWLTMYCFDGRGHRGR